MIAVYYGLSLAYLILNSQYITDHVKITIISLKLYFMDYY